jgi:hypothetical protein
MNIKNFSHFSKCVHSKPNLAMDKSLILWKAVFQSICYSASAEFRIKSWVPWTEHRICVCFHNLYWTRHGNDNSGTCKIAAIFIKPVELQSHPLDRKLCNCQEST